MSMIWLLAASAENWFIAVAAKTSATDVDAFIAKIHAITDPAVIATLRADEAAIKADPTNLTLWGQLEADCIAAYNS